MTLFLTASRGPVKSVVRAPDQHKEVTARGGVRILGTLPISSLPTPPLPQPESVLLGRNEDLMVALRE